MATLTTNTAPPVTLYSTTATLLAAAEFKTPALDGAAADDWIDTQGFGDIHIEVAADQVSADLGFTVVETLNPADAAFTRTRFVATLVVDVPICKHIPPHFRYMRVKYVNGGTGQGSFTLNVIGIRGERREQRDHMEEFGVDKWALLKDSAEVNLAVVSSPDVNYDHVVGSTTYFEVERLLIRAGDNTAGVPNTFFGIPALTNGLLIQVLDDTPAIVEHFHTDEIPIKEHFDMANLAGIDVDSDAAANKSGIAVRWTLGRAGKRYLLKPGWTFRVIVKDDISALRILRVSIQGLVATNYEF